MLREIADRTGISRMAVSLALRGKSGVSEATRKKVLKVAQELGYEPDPEVARLLSHIRVKKSVDTKACLALLTSGATPQDWKDISLLSVRVDRLRSWSRPGLLCIGDSAHAMSPVGGIGINLAIQDAVAAANILAEPLRQNRATHDDLRAVEKRRIRPTRWTQALQVQAHKRVVEPTLSGRATFDKLPLPIRLLNNYPWLRRFPARLIGMGLRPEHVKTPAAPPSR